MKLLLFLSWTAFFLVGVWAGIMIGSTIPMAKNAHSADICLKTLDEMCVVTNKVVVANNRCLDNLSKVYNYSFSKLPYLNCGGLK